MYSPGVHWERVRYKCYMFFALLKINRSKMNLNTTLHCILKSSADRSFVNWFKNWKIIGKTSTVRLIFYKISRVQISEVDGNSYTSITNVLKMIIEFWLAFVCIKCSRTQWDEWDVKSISYIPFFRNYIQVHTLYTCVLFIKVLWP